MKITIQNISAALKNKKYPLYRGDYNLNIIGVRSKNIDSNTFNDALVLLFEVDRQAQMHVFDLTTDPGIFYRKSPVNVDGTAVLKPGHYKSCWRIGLHQGKYNALVQRENMTVYRDNNKNSLIDDKCTSESGVFGINLHRAHENTHSMRVDKWSAGCQVVSSPVDFDLVMALVAKSSCYYGDKFSYTLLEESDL